MWSENCHPHAPSLKECEHITKSIAAPLTLRELLIHRVTRSYPPLAGLGRIVAHGKASLESSQHGCDQGHSSRRFQAYLEHLILSEGEARGEPCKTLRCSLGTRTWLLAFALAASLDCMALSPKLQQQLDDHACSPNTQCSPAEGHAKAISVNHQSLPHIGAKLLRLTTSSDSARVIRPSIVAKCGQK